MVQRVQALIGPTRSEDHCWTWHQLNQWLEPLSTDRGLRRGTKAAVTKAAKNGQGMTQVGFDDVAECFDDAISFRGLWESAYPLDELALLDWYEQHMIDRRRKTFEFPARIVRATGSIDALRRTPTVYVGTVHSFKGAEADTVYLFPDLSLAAYKAYEYGEPQQRDEVIRTMYVGMTRAKRELNLCQPSGLAVRWGKI